jgi:AcrR family transcriptional regulator
MSREERKRQTRKALMDSALGLIEQGQHFSNISLREVAKNAGVVPTSFYRHFQDMEELGLNLIDEFSVLLRRVRSDVLSAEQTITVDALLAIYVETITDNPALFMFIQQCRTSEHQEIRNTIRQELQGLAGELASELRVAFPNVSRQRLTPLSQVVVLFLMDAMIDVLDQTALGVEQSRIVARLLEQIGVISAALK